MSEMKESIHHPVDVWVASYLSAPSACSWCKAAFTLSVVCLLNVATLMYPTLPTGSPGLPSLLLPSEIFLQSCEVTGLKVSRCRESVNSFRGLPSCGFIVSVTCKYKCDAHWSQSWMDHSCDRIRLGSYWRRYEPVRLSGQWECRHHRLANHW